MTQVMVYGKFSCAWHSHRSLQLQDPPEKPTRTSLLGSRHSGVWTVDDRKHSPPPYDKMYPQPTLQKQRTSGHSLCMAFISIQWASLVRGVNLQVTTGPNFIELLSTKICLAWNFALDKNRKANQISMWFSRQANNSWIPVRKQHATNGNLVGNSFLIKEEISC